MSYYFKDPSGNTKELNLSSYWAKDISPSYSYDYNQFWVEPYGLQTHYNIPVKYVTGNSSAGSQTAYINKELYYYPISSSSISTSTTTTVYGTSSTTFTGNQLIKSSSSARTLLSIIFDCTQKVTCNGQTLNFQQAFFTSPFKEMPEEFITIENEDKTYTCFDTDINYSYDPGGPWGDYIINYGWGDYKCSSSNCPTYTKTEVFPILSSTNNFNGSISQIKLRLNPLYIQYYRGEWFYQGLGGEYYEVSDENNGAYTNSYFDFVLTPKSPTWEKTVTYTYKDPAGNSDSVSLYAKVQLSNNSITVTTTTPYGFIAIDGSNYFNCGFAMCFSVMNCLIDYNTSTPLTTINVNPSLIQYNNNLHSCYFRTPRDEVGPPYAGIFQGYSFYVAGKFSTLKAALTYDSSIAAAIYGTTYTVKNSQSTAYLQDGAICDTAGEKETVYSGNGPVYYIDTFNKTGGLTELKNSLSTDAGLLASPGPNRVTTTSGTKYSLSTVSNTLTLYESTGTKSLLSFPITTYNLTKYPLYSNSNYLYNTYNISNFNDSSYSANITINSFSWSASNTATSSTAAFYYQAATSGLKSLADIAGTTISLKAGSSNYLTGSYSVKYLYSNYTTSKTATLTMNYTLNNTLYTSSSYTLLFSTTYTAPSSCVGLDFYYSNGLNSCKVEYGTSSSYGSSRYALASSSASFTSSYRAIYLYASTTYFKISPYASSSSGRYNLKYVLYRGKVSVSEYNSLTSISSGSFYNPYYQQSLLGSYTDYWSPSADQPTYYYYMDYSQSEISYPIITNVEDNSWYKRKITVKNPNSFSVTMYYTSNKCTSSTSVDSSATWTNGGNVGANSTATFYITDRSGYSDNYIVVGIYCNNGYCCSSYYEEVKSSPSRITTFWKS